RPRLPVLRRRPRGDYSEFPDAVVVGDARQEPRITEIARLLMKRDVSVVANLLAIDPAERPRFLAKFVPEIAKLRSQTGRPHWIVLDEAHHCLPMGPRSGHSSDGIARRDCRNGASG